MTWCIAIHFKHLLLVLYAGTWNISGTWNHFTIEVSNIISQDTLIQLSGMKAKQVDMCAIRDVVLMKLLLKRIDSN